MPAARTKKPARTKSARSKPARSKPAQKVTAPSSGVPKIGKPANRALEALGITTRAQLEQLTEADLLAIHGFGPKGIAILRANGIELKKN